MSEIDITWWDAVQQLPATHRFVAHEPETPRYARARQKLRYALRRGKYLGCNEDRLPNGRVEIAVWAPPDGRNVGYYCCFRLFVDDGIATGAVLFCFYDGTEASPAIVSVEQARVFARDNGFSEEADCGIAD